MVKPQCVSVGVFWFKFCFGGVLLYLCGRNRSSMLFNSIEFLFFLPVVFALYWMTAKRLAVRNAVLLGASCLFYGWWDWRFLLLIVAVTGVSYISGILIDRYRESHRRMKSILWIDVVFNLGVLGVFKYFDFFARKFIILFNALGFEADSVTLDIILPVGISFYTFQSISYVIDVYRGDIAPSRNPLSFFTFVAFFPQLVAGPIERASNLLPQFNRLHRFDYASAVDGCRQMLWGFFKKVVVADNCAVVVNRIFADYTAFSGGELLIGVALFSFQVYGDFSGYSDIAIGVSRLFGINLSRNFNVPLFSRDIAEFWRRWHISLTSWFRDYLYIPLGGSRVSRAKQARNTFIVFLLSGFWHGPSWNYIVWGGYHALLYVPLQLTGRHRRHRDTVAHGRVLPTAKESMMMATTFMLCLVGLIFFRSHTLGHAWAYLCRIVTDFNFKGMQWNVLPYLWCLIMLVVEWFGRESEHPLQFGGGSILRYRAIRWSIYAVIAMLCLLYSGAKTNFLYFQF